MKTKHIYYISLFTLIIYSIYKATLGVHGDELHTIAMGDMIASGNSFFIESWFYLQLSAVINAPIIYVYKLIVGDLTGIVLFLRIVSIIIQLMISFYFYLTFREDFDEKYVMLASILFFIYIPDFRNMIYKVELMWFTLLLILFIYRYYKTFKCRYLILSGISVALCTLCYPPSGISVFFVSFLLYVFNRDDKKQLMRSIIILIGTCGICAVLFMTYIFATIGIKQFIEFFPRLLSDENITGNLYSKLIHPVIKIMAFFLLSYVPIVMVGKLKFVNKLFSNMRFPLVSALYLGAFLCQTFVERACITWHIITYPYALSLAVCAILVHRCNNEQYKKTFWIFEIMCISVVISMTIASNQGNISCTMGMIFATLLLVIWPQDANYNEPAAIILKEKKILNYVILIISLFAFLFPVYEWETTNCTPISQCSVFTEREKAEYGPMKGVSLGYSFAPKYKKMYSIVNEYVHEKDKLCIIDDGLGIASVGYMCKNIVYSTYSPQGGSQIGLSEKLNEYFTLNPSRIANVFIINEDFINISLDDYLVNTKIGKYIATNKYEIISCGNGYYVCLKNIEDK